MRYQFWASLMPIALSMPILAQDAPEPKEKEVEYLPLLESPHFYLGGRLGWGHFQGACDSSSGACNNDTFGGGIYAGYQLNDWFALEGGVTDYGKPDARYAGGRVSADTYGAELSAKLSYRLSSEWALFSRIGAAYQDIEKQSDWDGKQTSQDWNTLAAVGVDYRLTQRWSLRGEYQFIDGIGDGKVLQSDLHFTSLGLTYHFGQENPSVVVAPVSPLESESELTPVPPMESEPVTEKVSIDTVAFFDFDSSELIYNADLEALAVKLTEHSQGQIRIMGYTDSVGSLEYNQHLSEQRAQAAAEYFKRMGVAETRLIVEGKDESSPVASNDTKEGRAQNRRVEMHFETQEERVVENEEVVK
ncbi:Outer membrane protein A precursor [Vibrio chagasii]|nr:Outer membrane protein A precursor [Vibrio chagasii]CAH7294818.1 Outer membrane protein A precursor [Vibrio chagasii]CAH7454696.1 Outer membrane protein A precursor [Vibrio chagasii]